MLSPAPSSPVERNGAARLTRIASPCFLQVGLVYGLWIGFAIACAGTFLGEMACYILFRVSSARSNREARRADLLSIPIAPATPCTPYPFRVTYLPPLAVLLHGESSKVSHALGGLYRRAPRANLRSHRVEEKSVFYACLARLMREGGLWIITVVRFSALPGEFWRSSTPTSLTSSRSLETGHVVTAIQSTVGMSIWIYSIAVAISLPKQLAVVYLGVMFGETAQVSDPATIHKQRIISLSVFFGTGELP